MINDEMYETCKDCPYYYREINWCMYGEEDVPDNLEKKCEVNNEEIEELDFCEWWEMLDDIEQGEYNRCMKELER